MLRKTMGENIRSALDKHPQIQANFRDYSNHLTSISGDADVMVEILKAEAELRRIDQQKELKEMEYRHIETMERLKLDATEPMLQGQIKAFKEQLAEARSRFDDLKSTLQHTVKVEFPEQRR